MAAAMLLAGCMTLRGAEGAWGEVDEVAGALRRVLAEVEAGAAPDLAGVAALLDRARVTAITQAAGTGHAGVAALGVTLAFCQGGVERLQAQLETDPEAAIALAGALRVGCLMPLALLAAA